MTRQTHTILGLALGAWLTMLLLATAPVQAAETRDLILAAYSVPKEAYERHIIPAFQRHWKQKTGQDVRVRSSYGASGAQARAIIGGFDADVAVLSLEGDVDQIVKAGLITHDWRKAPHGGMISASVVAPRSSAATRPAAVGPEWIIPSFQCDTMPTGPFISTGTSSITG